MGVLAPIAGPMLIQFFIAGALYVVNNALAEDPDPMDQEEIDRGIMANQVSDQATLPLMYGRCRVGVNRVYAKTWGPDLRWMDTILVLGEGPIHGIVREDGTTFTTSGIDFPTSNPPLVYFDKDLWVNSSNYVTIQFFNGSSTQVVSTVLSGYDSSFQEAMRHTAFLYIQMLHDKENFNRQPNFTVVVDGLKIYNPITEVTEWTNNPALCAYDFFTRPSTRGGMGLDQSAVLTQFLSDSIDYCVDMGWTCNMALRENNYAVDNLRTILANFRGFIPPSNTGTYKILFRDLNYESTVMALTEADVVDGSFSLGQPDVLNRPNAIRMKYYSNTETDLYQLKDYVFTDTTSLNIDGDYREVTRGPFGISDLPTLQNMAYYLLERARNGKTVTLTGGRRTLALEPEDLVTVKHRVPGWTAQIMRVIGTNPDLENFTNTLTLLEESTEFYDADYDVVLEDLFQTTLPDPSAEVPDVINVSHSEIVYNYRDQSYTRWEIDFDPPDESVYPWFDYAEIWVKIGSSGDWRYMSRSQNNYAIDPAQEGEYYAVKMVPVNVFGKKRAFDNSFGVSTTIIGKVDTPSNLASMTCIANGDSVTIYATPVSDPDILGYEVRLGGSWASGIFISFNKAPSLRINGVRPGTHTFWMSPKDTSGKYSGTPVSASVTVFVPPGYTQLAVTGSWSWDYDGIGTHDNTEHETYDGGDAVKCSHTSDVLTGSWTSPTAGYDLYDVANGAAPYKVRLWGDFRVAFESTSTTWNGVAPSPTTWNDLGATATWNEIFQPTSAGRLEATLQYSTDDVTYYDIDKFEILSAEVEARYIRVVVTITDPTLDANLHLKELNMLAYTGPQ